MSIFIIILSVALPGQEYYVGDHILPYAENIELETWPRIALSQPYVQFEGWYDNTAVAHLSHYEDLSGEYSDEILLISPDTSWTIPAYEWAATVNKQFSMPQDSSLEHGVCASNWKMIKDGSAIFILQIHASDNDIRAMDQACIEFEIYLENRPPEVTVNMHLIRESNGRSVWEGSRDLTWFGGECAPIFDLPVLELAVISPDTNHLFFSILYGPKLEHFVVELPPLEMTD